MPPRLACDPRAGDLDLARRVLEHERAADLAYARVDVVDGGDGPLLMELELTEPRLFFGWAPPAAVERFADVVESRLQA